MSYKFRQTTHSTRRGLFWLDAPSIEIELEDGIELGLVARDADTLAEATSFHFECGGYSSEKEARAQGERFRRLLHILTSVLELEQIVEIEDKQVSSVVDAAKEAVRQKGGVLLDQRSGLTVIPDDGMHGEFVFSGARIIKANPPDYVLAAMKQLWLIDFPLDEDGQAVLEMLSLSTAEVSPATKYLTTYLALEQLIQRRSRAKETIDMLSKLVGIIEGSNLIEEEKRILSGLFGSLEEESFSSAFKRYMTSVKNPKEIEGIPTDKLASRCIAFRNKITHSPSKIDLDEARLLTKALRTTIFGILWHRFDLPRISIERPTDKINLERLEVRIL
jgi:hypothetical protein